MLNFLSYHPEEGLSEDFDQENFNPWQKGKRTFWLDLDQPSEKEIGILSSIFNFNSLAISSCLESKRRPWKTDFEKYLLLGLITPNNSLSEKMPELYFFISNTFVVTLHHEPIPFLEQVMKSFQKTPQFLSKGAGFIFYEISASLLSSFLDRFDELEEKLGLLEEQIFLETGSETVNDIFNFRRYLIYLHRVLGPQRDIYNSLQHGEGFSFFGDSSNPYLEELFEQYLRLLEHLSSLHDLSGNVLSTHLSLASNRLNEIVKVLTIFSAIMLPLTLVAGIYGMNFNYLPELSWRYGYFYSLGLMVVIGGGMLLLFRRKGWL